MTDPLEIALNEHIWYTTTTRGGKAPFVICKCTAELADTNAHTAHVARIARNTMAAMAAT
jgi:hypothetical protein